MDLKGKRGSNNNKKQTRARVNHFDRRQSPIRAKLKCCFPPSSKLFQAPLRHHSSLRPQDRSAGNHQRERARTPEITFRRKRTETKTIEAGFYLLYAAPAASTSFCVRNQTAEAEMEIMSKYRHTIRTQDSAPRFRSLAALKMIHFYTSFAVPFLVSLLGHSTNKERRRTRRQTTAASFLKREARWN